MKKHWTIVACMALILSAVVACREAVTLTSCQYELLLFNPKAGTFNTFDNLQRITKKEYFDQNGVYYTAIFDYTRPNIVSFVAIQKGSETKDTSTFILNGQGRIQAINSSFGDTTTYVYNADGTLGKLITLRHPNQDEQTETDIIELTHQNGNITEALLKDGNGRVERKILFEFNTNIRIKSDIDGSLFTLFSELRQPLPANKNAVARTTSIRFDEANGSSDTTIQQVSYVLDGAENIYSAEFKTIKGSDEFVSKIDNIQYLCQ